LVLLEEVLKVGVAQLQRMNGFLVLGKINDEGMVQEGVHDGLVLCAQSGPRVEPMVFATKRSADRNR
jgi:hypothetical protein